MGKKKRKKRKKGSLCLVFEEKPDTKSLGSGQLINFTKSKSSVFSFNATHIIALIFLSQINQKPTTQKSGCDLKPQHLLPPPPCSLPQGEAP